jgi:hypothetical protein
MTVEEMHIDVKAQLQRVGTNQNRKLDPGMIDWFLNVAQQQLVDASVEPREDGTPRFQVHRGRRENIQSLIVSRKELPAYYDEIQKRYFCYLPASCQYLLEDGCSVKQLCKGDIRTINYEVINVTKVEFPKSTGPEYYKTLQVDINGTTKFKLDDLQSTEGTGYIASPSADAHFYFRDYILSALKDQQIYWERFGDYYYPNHFIFISKGSLPSIQLLSDGVTKVGTSETKTLEVHDSSGRLMPAANSMIPSDSTMVIDGTPYFNTSYFNPTSELENGRINVYRDDSFIVCKVVSTFIRKPARINLTLGQDSELSQTVHQKITDRAVELMLNRVGDLKWKATAEQNIVNKNS